MRKETRATIGLFLVFLYYLPRIVLRLLLKAYDGVFRIDHNLTANPKVHLERAKRLLERGQNSDLLYVGVEIRFAVERMTQAQIRFAENVSNRMLDDYSADRKRRFLSILDEGADYPHKIWWVNRATGERFLDGHYKPLSKNKVFEIQGKLGNLLHARDGLMLGMKNDPWYIEIRKFLWESYEYLWANLDGNKNYFACKSTPVYEMERIELGDEPSNDSIEGTVQ